ncbi:MAG: hypothetical protein Q9160_007678 [Pyrenula sp. 1 TL-2023]
MNARGVFFTVDFLHKSIRNFLLENHASELQSKAAPDFDPMICLYHALLYNLTIRPRLFGWITQEVKQTINCIRSLDDKKDPLGILLLDEVDRVKTATYSCTRFHWTFDDLSASITRTTPFIDVLKERTHEEFFLAFAAKKGFVYYIDHKLDQPSSNTQRSLQNWLLVFVIPATSLLFRSWKIDSRAYRLAKLLLEKGADPNQGLSILGGCSIWECFLLWTFMDHLAPTKGIVHKRKERYCWFSLLLISHRADPFVQFNEATEFVRLSSGADSASDRSKQEAHNETQRMLNELNVPETLSEMLSVIFNAEQVQRLQAKIDEVTLRKLAETNASAQESPGLYAQAQQAIARASQQLIGLGSRFSGLSIGHSSS